MQNQNAGTPAQGNDQAPVLTLQTVYAFTAATLETVEIKRIAETVREFSVSFKEHADAIKSHKTEQRKPIRQIGKVLAIGERRYSMELGSGDTRKTFRDWLVETVNVDIGALPKRVLSASRVYSKLVIGGFLTEPEYDRCAVDWLELASSIIGLLPKNDDGINFASDAGLDLINALKKADAENTAGTLRDLRNKLQGKVTVGNGSEQMTLNAQTSTVLLERILATELAGENGGSTHGVLLTCSKLASVVKDAGKLPAPVAKNLLLALRGLVADFPADVAKAIDAETPKQPDASTVAETDDSAWAAKHFPANAANPNLRQWIAHFRSKAENNRLPENAAELTAHMQAYNAQNVRKGRKAKAEPVAA